MCVCSLSVKLLVSRLRRGVCVRVLSVSVLSVGLSSLLADFVGSVCVCVCVCVCALSVKHLMSRFFKGVCVCALK